MSQPAQVSDSEFVDQLGAAIDRYLRSVDQWEAAYQKYYRLPGYAATISHDLEAEERDYHARRRELEEMLPRARRLCYRHRLREAFSGLLRISLGAYAPQERMDSAIGRNERNAVAVCLVELRALTREWEAGGAASAEPEKPPARGSLLQRLVDFFY
jgi:hypothetical protein